MSSSDQGGLVQRQTLFLLAQLQIQLEAAHRRQVVVFRVEKEVLEEGGGHFFIGTVAGAQPPVNLQDGVLDVGGLVGVEGVTQARADIDPVDEEEIDLFDALSLQHRDLVFGQGLVALDQDFAVHRVQDVVGHHPAHQFRGGSGNVGDAGLIQFLQQRRGQPLHLLDHDFAAFGVRDVGGGGLVLQQFRDQGPADAFSLQEDPFGLIKEIEQFFGGSNPGPSAEWWPETYAGGRS